MLQGERKQAMQLNVKITGHRETPDFTAYTLRVQGEEGEVWEVEKRYSSFDRLHDELSEKFVVPLPALPGKKWFGNHEPEFVEQRARELQTYLQQLVRLPTVGRCELVMTFLASGDTGARRPVQ